MKVFLITCGVFCVLHIVQPLPLPAPPIAQRLEAKENEGSSSATEDGARLKELVEQLEALVEEGMPARKKPRKQLEFSQ